MMARRLRRDLIGHFIRNRQREQQACTHACCRGYRVHPDNMPVILPNRTLRRASDDDLAEHYKRVNRGDSEKDRRAEMQIIHEMERRDRIEDQRRQRREAAAGRKVSRAMGREEERDRIFREAEDYTRGNWVNKAGERAGISDREILTGREAVFQRYASSEARAYFQDHPRPTTAYFRGKDTRVAYSDRPSREHWINRRVGRRAA